MKQWYEELFENYAGQYDKESFTKGTKGEVDFIEKEIGYDKSARILDVGCGTGRHSLELSRRGYQVTGLDISESMLSKARRSAKTENLNVEFLKKDARGFNFGSRYDLAIMLCEGAFPLMETDEMNFKIMENIYASLKAKGKVIFSTLNGLFPLVHATGDFTNQALQEGRSSENRFDLMTFREYSVYVTTDDHGKLKTLQCNERYYIPPEITWMLKSIGFTDIDIMGCKLGAFSRSDALTPDDFEMLVVAIRDAN